MFKIIISAIAAMSTQAVQITAEVNAGNLMQEGIVDWQNAWKNVDWSEN